MVDDSVDRSPVDLVVTADGRWCVSANQLANTLSLIRCDDRTVVDEVACGQHPTDLALGADGRIWVTCTHSGQLQSFAIVDEGLRPQQSIRVGMQPYGVAISPDASTAYVSQLAAAQLAVVDLNRGVVRDHFNVGKWPKFLTLTQDGARIAVGNSGSSEIQVLDTRTGEPLHRNRLTGGINIGHLITSPDGQHAYFPWMVYRTNPINPSNIRRGWVLASRVARVRLDEHEYREALSLDVPRRAVADPYGIAIRDDGQQLIVSSSGTHELLIYRLPDLPLVGLGGPGDLIDRRLQNDRERFRRLHVGGRPMGIQLSDDGQTLWVANYLRNSIQVVDMSGDGTAEEIVAEIDLGGPDQKTLARRGMEIFYDARFSLDQWYSCHSCHQDGGSNARAMDTWNDGTEMTYKTVLPLYNVRQTFPWTWHGWQRNLSDAMHKSVTSTMQGEPPSEEDERALIAYLATLKLPPNPHLDRDGNLSEAAGRGKKVFMSRKAGCIDCHNGPSYSDGKIHDVGTGSDSDAYQGFNTPSLRGAYLKTRWLHHGRARDLRQVIERYHRPEDVNGEGDLSEQEVDDLIEFLKSL